MGTENTKGLCRAIVISICEALIVNSSGEAEKCKPYASRPCMPMRVRVAWFRNLAPEAETPMGKRFDDISQPFPIFIHLGSTVAGTVPRTDIETVPSIL